MAEILKITSELERSYSEIKQNLNFMWWSMKKCENGIEIIIDGKNLEECLRDHCPGFSFGSLVQVKKENHLGVKLYGSSKTGPISGIYLAVYDFCKTASEISRGIDTDSIDSFCKTLQKEVDAVMILASETLSENSRDDTEKSQEKDASDEESESTPINDKSIKGNRNSLLEETSKLYLGEYYVPLKAIREATEFYSLREINPHHKRDLFKSFQSEYENGYKISVPSALGFISSCPDENEIQEELENGNIPVHLLDGHHTHDALIELSALYPSEKSFQKRKVKVYKKLNSSSALMLAILCNEEACNSLRTSAFDKVKVMRRELVQHYQGRFSKDYQFHIFKLFNALCPTDANEEKKRKKSLQHLIRISTMNDECWDLMNKIMNENPNSSLISFRELGNLSVEQSLQLMEKVIKKEIKLSDMRGKAKEMEAPQGCTLTFQRLRACKKSKDVKTDHSWENGDMESSQSEGTLEETVMESANGVHRKRSTAMVEENELVQTKLPKRDKQHGDKVITDNGLQQEWENEMKILKEENHNLKVELEKKENLELEVKKKEKENCLLKKELKKMKELENEIKILKTEKNKEEEKKQEYEIQLELIKKENDKLKEELQNMKAASLPFSLGSPVRTSTPIKESKHGDTSMIYAVEYRNKIFFTLLEEGDLVYCKGPYGKIANKTFVNTQTENSFKLNRRDRLPYNENFVIHSFKTVISNDILQREVIPHDKITKMINKYVKEK